MGAVVTNTQDGSVAGGICPFRHLRHGASQARGPVGPAHHHKWRSSRLEPGPVVAAELKRSCWRRGSSCHRWVKEASVEGGDHRGSYREARAARTWSVCRINDDDA